MAQISTNLFKNWKDGDVVTAMQYKLERDSIVLANNDTYQATSGLTNRMADVETDVSVLQVDLSNGLSSKTDKTGNHLGSWQGLQPSDFDGNQQVIDLADVKNRLTAVENRPTVTGASSVNITDAGNYFAGSEVEAALQEIGAAIATNRGQLITSVNNILNT